MTVKVFTEERRFDFLCISCADGCDFIGICKSALEHICCAVTESEAIDIKYIIGKT